MSRGRLLETKLKKAAKEQQSQRDISDALLKKKLDEQEKKLAELLYQLQEEQSLRLHWEGVAAKQAATLRRLRGARPRPGDDLF